MVETKLRNNSTMDSWRGMEMWIVARKKHISAPREKNLPRTTRHSDESLAMKIKDLNRPFSFWITYLNDFITSFHSTQRCEANNPMHPKSCYFFKSYCIFCEYSVRFSHQTPFPRQIVAVGRIGTIICACKIEVNRASEKEKPADHRWPLPKQK